MPIQSKKNFMRGLLLGVGAVLILAALGLAGHALAQEPAAHGQILVVTHVDFIPPDLTTGTNLVKQYVADTRKDKGLVRIEAGAQISRTNHMAIVEVWENQKALDDHIAAAHTVKFRQQVDPMLGSPYDERLHQSLE
jgi:quinol monooxygenase YgiN